MANLIVCCDGTWNTPEGEGEDEDDGIATPTNVVKFFGAINGKDADRVEQKILPPWCRHRGWRYQSHGWRWHWRRTEQQYQE